MRCKPSSIDRAFVPTLTEDAAAGPPASAAQPPLETDRRIVLELIEQSEASLARLEHDIETTTGAALIDFIHNDIQELQRILFDRAAIRCSCRRWRPPGG